MDRPQHPQIESALHRLDRLMQDGRHLHEALAVDSEGSAALAQHWQRECEKTVAQLSGGSKTHWLARAYNDAFLLPAEPGHVVTEVTLTRITEGILAVLQQAAAALKEADEQAVSTPAAAPTRQIRFDFVGDPALRIRLEQVWQEARAAREQGAAALALVSFCSILDAIITDAIGRAGREGRVEVPPAEDGTSSWSFDARVAAAERAGLISAGCSRLPAVARRYRDLLDANGDVRPDAPVTARDATVTAQVLTVIMRDLSPGR